MSEQYPDADSYFAAMRTSGYFSYSKPFIFTRTYDEIGEPTGVAEYGRYAYQVLDPDDHVSISRGQGNETIIRETGTRQQIKAIFLQESRSVQRLMLQRFNKSGKALRDSFSLSNEEVEILRNFLHLVETVELEPGDGSRVDQATMTSLLQQPEVAEEVYSQKKDEIYSLIEDDITARDVLALKRKRKSLIEFKKMLEEPDYFDSLREKADGVRRGPEAVWQEFFDTNRWMFGLGLASQLLLSWEEGKLEQTIVGRSIAVPGKRVDALLHSAGALSAVCLVEIKRHDTELLEPEQYRAGAWQVSKELSGGIAQCHANVASLLREHEKLIQRDQRGFTTGKTAIVCRPRSYLVIGSLREFREGDQVNEPMFRSFEDMRRSLSDPEVITYDELYIRASHILQGMEVQSRDPAGA